ncbi:LDLR chaperone boca-like [Orbicella faveolata]|uniref:LDLR chaperone boca-like n=1 Tax=Orbicella faveolata TaxID=48498 RepID=UPI0009E306A2|nr:LDLR chaperone boca-like [Orbicella faveolata]
MARNYFKFSLLFWTLFLIILLQNSCLGKDKKPDPKNKKEKSSKIGKNILDYNEADLYKLLDQWEENDEDIDEEDRYDDHDPRKPPPPTGGFDPLQFKGDPMALLKQSKKGKVVMLFVSVAGTPSRKDTEQITARWQTSLFNAQFQVERYLVSDDRALFMLKDGSHAWDVKDFLITQPDCKLVEFDNQQFPGAGAKQKSAKTEL